jgi:hypothetical protein
MADDRPMIIQGAFESYRVATLDTMWSDISFKVGVHTVSHVQSGSILPWGRTMCSITNTTRNQVLIRTFRTITFECQSRTLLMP